MYSIPPYRILYMGHAKLRGSAGDALKCGTAEACSRSHPADWWLWWSVHQQWACPGKWPCCEWCFDSVTKHSTVRTVPEHRSFCDLFMQISNILQQSAGMAVSKCINCQPHRAFEPFYSGYIVFGGRCGRHGWWKISIIAVALFKSRHNQAYILHFVKVYLFFILQHVSRLSFYVEDSLVFDAGASGAVFRDTNALM